MNQLRSPYMDMNPPSPFPFGGAGSDKQVFPPVCIRTHWNPTAILTHTLPDQQVSLPMDFRPWTKVCKEYVTSGPIEQPPIPPSSMVFPSGGGFYPPGRYATAIDTESELKELNRPLDKWCSAKKYRVSPESTLFNARATVPTRAGTRANHIVDELAMPRVLINLKEYGCRHNVDVENWNRSQLPFNNATRQARMNTIPAIRGGDVKYRRAVSPLRIVGLATIGSQAPSM